MVPPRPLVHFAFCSLAHAACLENDVGYSRGRIIRLSSNRSPADVRISPAEPRALIEIIANDRLGNKGTHCKCANSWTLQLIREPAPPAVRVKCE